MTHIKPKISRTLPLRRLAFMIIGVPGNKLHHNDPMNTDDIIQMCLVLKQIPVQL